MNWGLLQNSLLLAGAATLVSVLLGFLAALGVRVMGPVRARACAGLAVMILALPPFLVTNCWLQWLGPDGPMKAYVPWGIQSIPGAVWILSLLLWPVTFLLVHAAWTRLDPEMLESDPALGGGRLVLHLLWPMARPAVGIAALITVVLALNNFTVPALLQIRVLPAAIWVDFSVRFDTWAALRTGWPLMFAPLGLLVLIWMRPGHAFDTTGQDGNASCELVRRQLGRGWSFVGRAAMVCLGVVSLGLPLVQLVFSRATWVELPNVIRAVPGSVMNSWVLAAAAAAVCLAFALALWRWKPVGALWLLFFVPGTLLGIGWIGMLNRPAFQWLYQSEWMVVLAWGVRYLAVAWLAVRLAMQRSDRDVADAARLQGASGWPLLRHIHWPQIASPSAVAAYVVYLLCLWDVETLILIVPPGGETLALRVFNLLHYGHNAQVNAMCILLLVLAVGPLVLWTVCATIISRRGSHEE